MTNLDKLTAKIRGDAESRADKITADAKWQAERIVAEAIADATREKERILAEAETEAAHAGEQIILGKTLAIRDQNLNAKQKMLDEVFAAALEKMHAMTKDEFMKFLTSYLSGMKLSDEEIILPKKYGIKSVDELNKSLNAKLTLHEGERDIEGGFILCKQGIEQNNTFESLISYYRYELEGTVLKMLY